MDYSLTGKIVDVKEDPPEVPIEQWVTLELSNGQKITLLTLLILFKEEHMMQIRSLIGRNTIGRTVKVSIGVQQTNDIVASKEHRKGFFGFTSAEESGGVVAGEVVNILPLNKWLVAPGSGFDREIVLDVGSGQVGMASGADWATVGTYVETTAYRLGIEEAGPA